MYIYIYNVLYTYIQTKAKRVRAFGLLREC